MNDDDYIPSPREKREPLEGHSERFRGMWELFNHCWGGSTISTQSSAVRRWIQEQEKKQ